MEREKQDVFREKSLERVSSPDRLDQYLRVSSPAAWMGLAVLILLLAAAIAWACVATVPVVKTVDVTVKDGQVTGTLDVSDGTYSAEVTVGEESPLSLLGN